MIMDMNLTNNVIIGRQNIKKYKSKFATVKTKNAISESENIISLFDVKTPGTNTLATALSGGNQQKFVVGRELEDDPSLCMADSDEDGWSSSKSTLDPQSEQSVPASHKENSEFGPPSSQIPSSSNIHSSVQTYPVVSDPSQSWSIPS